MAGLRLDHAGRNASFVLWVALYLAFFAGYYFVFEQAVVSPELKTAAVIYAVFVWVLYYIGNTILLQPKVSGAIRAKLGEAKALRLYNAIVGLMFANQAHAHGAIYVAFAGSITFQPYWILAAAGALLIVIGTGIKFWATAVTSIDTYYYNDMFLGRPVESCKEYVVRGPYKFLKNPMYGIGNLQGYGAALLIASWEGLVVAAAYHCGIYLFQVFVERPFVNRVYRNPAAAA